jgi:two-component system, response regulator PdtaR
MLQGEDCIVLVDDEALILIGLKIMLSKLGYKVCGTAMTTNKALSLVFKVNPKLIFLDYRLNDGTDGVEAAKLIREKHSCFIIFITGSSDPETVENLKLAKPDGLLFKPILPYDLTTAINALCSA